MTPLAQRALGTCRTWGLHHDGDHVASAMFEHHHRPVYKPIERAERRDGIVDDPRRGGGAFARIPHERAPGIRGFCILSVV